MQNDMMVCTWKFEDAGGQSREPVEAVSSLFEIELCHVVVTE